jgi:hypothetical protein
VILVVASQRARVGRAHVLKVVLGPSFLGDVPLSALVVVALSQVLRHDSSVVALGQQS